MTSRARHTPPRTLGDTTERARIKSVYDDYSGDPEYSSRWAGPAFDFMIERRWAHIRDALRRSGADLGSGRVLDIGAQRGDDCARLRQLGIDPGRIIALELLERYAREARRRHPWMMTVTGDALQLPFVSGSFSLVHQSTMLSSVLDPGRRRQVLREIDRILQPGGIFLSYDMRYRNPWNRQTRPLPASEIRRSLPGWKLTIASLTGLPPLLRLLAPVSLTACRIVEAMPWLRSHLLVMARKPFTEGRAES